MSTQFEEKSEAGPTVVVQERKARPVVLWAAVGVVFLAVEAWTLGSWVFGDNFKTTPNGPTPVPTWMWWSLRINEAIAIGVLLLFTYLFLIRPWVRDRKTSTDGLFFMSYFLVSWQDPGINYSQVWATYNTELTNMGSWLNDMPGALWPNGHMFSEPILWVWFGYGGASFAIVLGTNYIMRKAKARWPRLGTAGLLGFCLLGGTLLFFLIEVCWMRMGVYTYAGSIPSLTLWAGHYYQYPIYEGVIGGFVFTVWAALRYFRDDKGHTFAERGIDEVRVGSKTKTFIRFLAISGVIQAAMMFTYNLPHQFFATHAGDWPADITNRSYFTDGLCGPGTVYACPGPGKPILRPGSDFITPDGKVRPAESAPRDGQTAPNRQYVIDTPAAGG